MISKGYTLWLMPKGVKYKRFSNLIKKLAQQYAAPVFQPHITLLGELMNPQGEFRKEESEIKKLVEKLVSDQKSFPVTLRQIDYQDFHFRALFIKVAITEPLQELHNKAKEIFKMDVPPYMPHISLLYGNYPNELKEKIITEIGRDQTVQFEVSSVYLIRGGEVQDWKIIKEFTFS